MLPELFLLRMERMLGADYPRFLSAISDAPERAFRVNTAKVAVADFLAHGYLSAEPIPYFDGGFYTTEERPGRLPAHHAGMLYMQDPSAMATLSALPLGPDFRVLDLCASPGGKTTQAAAALTGGGFVAANEFVPSRCKTLVGNVERMGLRNTLVMNSDVFKLEALYPSYFDLVLVDAPCSGEGMLRKYAAAAEEWSEENVRRCAVRQAELLSHAATCVCGGGYLLYSTCTFSVEENEMNVDAFLSAHPDFRLCPVSEGLLAHTADGILFDGCRTPDIALCRRFYPHVSRGEGQFFALMQRVSGDRREAPAFRDASLPLSKEEKRIVDAFLSDCLEDMRDLRVRRVGERLVILPAGMAVPAERVFSSGVLLGELRKGVLFPHHQFFTAFGAEMRRRLSLSSSDADIGRYLAGEEISSRGLPSGFASVLCDGAALGGGKVVGETLKNHYPKGLRMK